MEQNKQYSSTVIFSALSAVLFFAPFIQPSLKKEQWSAEEKTFLLSRCRVGNLLWFFLLACLLAFWGAKLGGGSVFLFLSELFAYLIFALLGISVVLLSLGLHFESTSLQQTPIQKKQMLTSFLPLWSSYQRFRLQQFEKPYWWLKEAQLWLFGICFLLLLSPSLMPWMVLGALMLLRVGLLAFGWDLLSQTQKIWIHHGFQVVPWEIFSLVILQIQTLWAKLLKKPFNPQERLLVYQTSYHGKKTGRIQWLSILIRLPITVLLVWSRWNTQLWWKMIPLIWSLLWSLIIFSSKTPFPKLPIIAEFTAKNETSI